MGLSPQDILKIFAPQARRSLSTREILGRLRLPREERQEVVRLLKSLVREGLLVRVKGGRYALAEQGPAITGTVSVHRDGYGFVSRKGEGADIFIPARHLAGVMNGDKVAVRVVRRGYEGKSEGRIIKVVERAHRTVVGRFEQAAGFGLLIPADPQLGREVYIPGSEIHGARSGQMVEVRIDAYPERTHGARGSVVRVLGAADDPEVEVLTIAHKYSLPVEFPDELLSGLDVPSTVQEAECRGREDLRKLPFVTIDGETARDFDDAVTVSREAGGAIRLWVAIADVGHYVKSGTPLDQEAYDRGTSVYFPGRCIPMLPEALSNGICSLNPGVDRLVVTAELLFDGKGNRLESRFYPAVIRSQARLTYTEVRDRLSGDVEGDAGRPAKLGEQLEAMADLAHRLMEQRRRRGSLDFDLPEAEVVLDLRGRPEEIIRSERNLAHRIIEEFMLAANEAVAAFLTERQAPLLFRIHDPPDLEKLYDLQEFLAHFNCGLRLEGKGVRSIQLQELLDSVEGRPEERVVNHVVLRSLKQARYSPENVGHFGLAAQLYCHFTSPIRRYPDLVVHRILRSVLEGRLGERRRARLERELPSVGEQTSQRERRAMEAEREIVALKKCQIMADRVGETYTGIISGVQPFGFFVELEEVFVEGLVHIAKLADDFYHYETERHRLIGERQRRIFQVGEEVRVRVAGVNLDRREIDFELEEEGALPEAGRRRKQNPRRGRS